jgi:DNA-binding NtrC family response regulator
VDTGERASRSRILCVDDEPHVLRALVWLLGGRFDVHTATHAAEALDLAQKNDYDVVISDQRMPGVTGVELLREVRRRAPRAMRILLTGYSDLEAIERSANEAEVFRFVTKPWSVQELVAVATEAAAIARRAPVPSAAQAQPGAPAAPVLVFDGSPEGAKLVAEELRGLAPVHHAPDLAQALAILATQPVAVLISEMKVGDVDATRLIRAARERHPAIVSLVFSATRDAERVMALINEGQVFRLIPKPAQPGFVRVVVDAALRRHRELRDEAQLVQRYRLAASPAAAETLARDLAVMDQAAAARRPARMQKEGRSGVLRWLLGK